MSSSKRLFGCSLADVSGTKKARRPVQYKVPAFPKGLRANSMNRSSVDSSFLTSSPPEGISPNLYTCPICLGIPRIPVQLSNCGHLGCMTCFQRHLQISGVTHNGFQQRLVASCPLCRADFAEDNLKVFSSWLPLYKAVFGLLMTECSVSDSSSTFTCSWSGPVMDLLHHESYECPARRIVCPNPFCRYVDSESKVRQHFSTCSCLQVRCMDCFLPIRWESRDTHNCEQTLMDALRGKSLIYTYIFVNRNLIYILT